MDVRSKGAWTKEHQDDTEGGELLLQQVSEGLVGTMIPGQFLKEGE